MQNHAALIPPNGDQQGTPSARLSTPISVIVPAYNEENAIRQQIQAVEQALGASDIPHEIIVIDDGSRDRTADEALLTNARVLRHLENRGYGASIKTGIDAARYDTIVIMDADGTYPPDQIPALVAALDTADMVVGARTGNEVHVPFLRRPGKWILRALAVQIAGKPIPDLNSGLRAFRRECVKQYFPILSNRFSFTTTVTLALLADDYRVVYLPINYHRRIGKSKIAPRHFMDFLMLVLRMAMLFQPMKIFVPLALACVGLGVLKVIFDILSIYPRMGTFSWSFLFQPVLSTSAILLLLVGLQLLLIGMVADGALRRIAQHNGPLVPSHGVQVFEATSRGERIQSG
ncbi:MAG TPA: glycosyltransferase family 2 protein [Anaerolineae bacterium]|nr:glycosyltransferase family 2 protein [Anaerolineae bacterium]